MHKYSFDKTSFMSLPAPLRPFSSLSICHRGKEEESIGSKSKEITWHNSRREWLLSIRDCISQILIRQLSLAGTSVSVARKAGEKDKETRVHNARETRARQSERRTMLKGERTNFFLGAPERSPKKVKRGTTATRSEGCVALMGREVRLAAVPRVVMRN